MPRDFKISPHVNLISRLKTPLNVFCVEMVFNVPYMGSTVHSVNIYKQDTIKLRDWLNEWIESVERLENQSKLTDKDINTLKQIELKMADLSKELNDAIARIRDSA